MRVRAAVTAALPQLTATPDGLECSTEKTKDRDWDPLAAKPQSTKRRRLQGSLSTPSPLKAEAKRTCDADSISETPIKEKAACQGECGVPAGAAKNPVAP